LEGKRSGLMMASRFLGVRRSGKITRLATARPRVEGTRIATKPWSRARRPIA
jgi:hypothetical protein